MGKSSTKAKNAYNAKAYDRISVTVKKGVQEKWKSMAEKQGLSLNAFISKAVEQMEVLKENLSKNIETEKSERELLVETATVASDYLRKVYALYFDLIRIDKKFEIPNPYISLLRELFNGTNYIQGEFVKGRDILHGRKSVEDFKSFAEYYELVYNRIIEHKDNLEDFEEAFTLMLDLKEDDGVDDDDK